MHINYLELPLTLWLIPSSLCSCAEQTFLKTSSIMTTSALTLSNELFSSTFTGNLFSRHLKTLYSFFTFMWGLKHIEKKSPPEISVHMSLMKREAIAMMLRVRVCVWKEQWSFLGKKSKKRTVWVDSRRQASSKGAPPGCFYADLFDEIHSKNVCLLKGLTKRGLTALQSW